MDTECTEGPVDCHRELRSVGSGVETGLVQGLWRSPCCQTGHKGSPARVFVLSKQKSQLPRPGIHIRKPSIVEVGGL